MDLVEEAGLLLENTRTNILSNRLVIIAAERYHATGSTVENILGDKDVTIALCDPIVPIGNYARQYLQKKGLYDRVLPVAIKVDTVRAVLAAVETGNADLGIVYQTDAAIARASKVIFIVPEEEGPGIVYPLAIVKTTGNMDKSRELLDYFQSPMAAQRYREAGFLLVK